MTRRIQLALLTIMVAVACGLVRTGSVLGAHTRVLVAGAAGRTNLVRFARRYLGVRYVYGGVSPRTGFDCSGFTRFVYAHFGIALPHFAAGQFALGRSVPRDRAPARRPRLLRPPRARRALSRRRHVHPRSARRRAGRDQLAEQRLVPDPLRRRAPPRRLVSARAYHGRLPGTSRFGPSSWTVPCSPAPGALQPGRAASRRGHACANSPRRCRRARGSRSRRSPCCSPRCTTSSGVGLLVLLAEDADARDAAEGAAWFIGGERVGLFPSRGVRHGSGLEPPPHLVGERLRALEVLAAGGLVCASAVALAEGIAPASRAAGAAPDRPRRRAGNRRPGRAPGARRLRARRAGRGARPLRGSRRPRRRVPGDGPRASPHRAVR